MQTLRVAWRNLVRNPRRTLITAVALTLDTAVLIASLALMTGMQRQLVRNATRLVIGDAQIHAAGYRRDRSFYTSIEGAGALVADAARHGIRAAPRGYGQGLVSCGSKSAGANFLGMVPRAEREAFELARELQEGTFLPDAAAGRVVIGRKLARSLHAQVGSELVAVVQGADGSMGNETFQVAGVLKTVSDEIDRGAVLMHRDDFDRLFVAGGRVHEIALAAGAVTPAALRAALAPLPAGLELMTWNELLPSVSDMVTISGAVIMVFALLFFLAVGLGVMNTMLMATHDRVRELGMAMALGASAWRLIREISTEGFLLGLVSTAAGLIVGLALAAYTQAVGIDMSVFGDASFGFSGVAWDPVWRGQVRLGDVAAAVASVWVLCVLASLYPAIKAARVDPVRAINEV